MKPSLQRAQDLGILNILFNLALFLIISCHQAENSSAYSTSATEVLTDRSTKKGQLILYMIIPKEDG